MADVYWHAWGRKWGQGEGNMIVVIGPTALSADDPQVMSTLSADDPYHYLKTFMHEPSEVEKDELVVLIPEVIHEEPL